MSFKAHKTGERALIDKQKKVKKGNTDYGRKRHFSVGDLQDACNVRLRA